LKRETPDHIPWGKDFLEESMDLS